jgi:hypothetical protein
MLKFIHMALQTKKKINISARKLIALLIFSLILSTLLFFSYPALTQTDCAGPCISPNFALAYFNLALGGIILLTMIFTLRLKSPILLYGLWAIGIYCIGFTLSQIPIFTF